VPDADQPAARQPIADAKRYSSAEPSPVLLALGRGKDQASCAFNRPVCTLEYHRIEVVRLITRRWRIGSAAAIAATTSSIAAEPDLPG
jgi:hypothetical protein